MVELYEAISRATDEGNPTTAQYTAGCAFRV
jgi:hypothetical protein